MKKLKMISRKSVDNICNIMYNGDKIGVYNGKINR